MNIAWQDSQYACLENDGLAKRRLVVVVVVVVEAEQHVEACVVVPY